MSKDNPFESLSFNTARNIVMWSMLIIFLMIGFLSYQMGEYSGMKKICKPLFVGKDLEGNVVCFNLTEQNEKSNPFKSFEPENISWYGVDN